MTEGREPQASALLPGGSRRVYVLDIVYFILLIFEN